MMASNGIEGHNRLSVAEIDAVHGTRCDSVLETAIFIEPKLRSTVITVGDIQSCIAFSEMYAGGNTRVVVSRNIEGFERDLNEILQTRFVRLFQLFERLGRTVLTSDAIEFCFAHELGHASRYLNFQQDFPGENERFLDELHVDFWNDLPLSTSSGQARNAWRHNTGGYRTNMQRAGYTEESFLEALRVNSFMYSQTREEALCDDFALWVLARINMPKSTP